MYNVPAVGSDWHEVPSDSAEPGAQNDVVINGSLQKVDNSPAALEYRAWVESTVLPGAPAWVASTWKLIYVIPFDTDPSFAGTMLTPKGHDFPGLLQINLDGVSWSRYGDLHHVTIHELAHHCDRNKSCDLPFNEAVAVESFGASASITTTNANHDTPVPAMELLAELAAFSVTGQVGATVYTAYGAENSAKAAAYQVAKDGADAAKAAQDRAYALYESGQGSHDEYMRWFEERLVLRGKSADLRRTLDADQEAHVVSLCDDFTEALRLAGMLVVPECQ